MSMLGGWVLASRLMTAPLESRAPSGTQNLTVMGATSMLPYARAVIARWADHHPQVRVALSGGGSYAGWYGLKLGHADVALSDLAFPAAPGVSQKLVGTMPVLFILNRRDHMKNLSLRQLEEIWQGRVSFWNQCGGANIPIHLVVRPLGSGARAVVGQRLGTVADRVSEIVQLSNGAVVRTVQETPGAIGYVEGDRPWPGVVVASIDGTPYRPSSAWPFTAWPRVYWHHAAGSAVTSIVGALTKSPLRARFGLIPVNDGARSAP